MLTDYFKLQGKLLNRKLVDFGISQILGYPLVILGFYLCSQYIVEKLEHYTFIYLLFPILLVLKLSDVNRNNFLKQMYFNSTFYGIRCLENIAIGLPFFLFLITKEKYVESVFALVIPALLTFINLNYKTSWVIPTPFSKQPFEFMVGFRKSFPLLLLLFSLGFIALKVNNLNLGIATIVFIQLISGSFYTKVENPYFVWIHEATPKNFLIAKLKKGIKNQFLLTLPNLLLISCYFYQNLDEIALFYAIGSLFFVTNILMKYASFPNEIGLPQIILLGISLYMPPLLFLFIPYFYKEAILKLKIYLQ